MTSKKRLAKELKKISKKFVEKDSRKKLLESLKGDKTQWYIWTSQMKNIFNNIDKAESVKFQGLLLVLEQKPDSKFNQNNLKKFLIDKVEYYKYYDFDLEKKLKTEQVKIKNIWTSKVLRLFISRSFLGIIIIVLILGFIVWFYVDRESCLEFVNKVVDPFLRAVR